MSDPMLYSVRTLAAEHHLSIKRVDAILRLKGLEQHWIKVSYFYCQLTHTALLLYDEHKKFSISL